MPVRRTVIAMLAVAGLMWGALPAAAQDYPNRPITMIVPFAAGGPTDLFARVVGEHMSRTLGQQIVVENVVGAGGTTGTARAKRAAPDGYTIMMGHMGTHGAAPALYPNLAYNPETDFAPIGMVAGTPILIVARKDFPAKDLSEFVKYVKANESKVNEAHAGVGSVSYTTCTLLNSILNIKPTAVPFNGTGPALNALLGGQVDYMCDQIVNLVSQIEGGAIKAYAIATPSRSPALPNVPTTKESGLPEYEVSAWNAMFAPKGTPQPIVDKLTAALDKALNDENVKKRMLELGSVIPDAPERGQKALANFVNSEIVRWTPVLKAAQAQN
jgi:putative tricarboxylic transport membrane protein